jgi:colanic acid biosynthesis glycosyl transferase WcaI
LSGPGHPTRNQRGRTPSNPAIRLAARTPGYLTAYTPTITLKLGSKSPTAIRAARRLERACYRVAVAIVCPTEGIAGDLAGRPESSGKVRRIPPAVDLARFAPPGDSGERSATDHCGGFRVLYAGTIGLSQGLGTLFDAAAVLEGEEKPSVEFLIAGDGAQAPELRARLATEGPANVRMLGAVPKGRIPELYAEVDAAVVLLRHRPLFAGALPTKMLEAMAASRPIVLSAAGEAARFIEKSGGGAVVPPEDPVALAAVIRELARDPERRMKLGAAGRSWVERGFAHERAVGEWHGLLQEVEASG